MAAILRQDSPERKAKTPEGFAEEHVKCADGSCDAKYVMAYHPSEIKAEDGSDVLGSMREKAAELVASTHSLHDFKSYVWGGLAQGWVVALENDLSAAGI